MRPTRAEIDLSAIAANAATLAHTAPGAELCAVVKADGYGHGSVPVARAALAGGAGRLAVALVEEARLLREGGIEAPILTLSQLSATDAAEAVALGVEPTVDTLDGVDALADAMRTAGTPDPADPVPVHLKVDTGMHRVGAQPPEVPAIAREIVAAPGLELAALWTHCATADELDSDFTACQLARFAQVTATLAAEGMTAPVHHAGNSAVAIAHPAGHHQLVRCGIALYGIAPSEDLSGRVPLRPAMRLVSEVSHVKVVAAGEAISYGQRYRLRRPSVIATVPVGYADGVRRNLSGRAEVLIGGRRRPVAGTVTMDQITVDCGDDPVAVGEEVVLLGRQGDETILAEEWARLLDTIGYEVICGISHRVPRTYREDDP